MTIKRSWRKEPMVWLIIALPLSAVIAGVLTIWIATRHADTLVSKDYYKVGMAPLQHTEQDEQAARLGLKAVLQASGDTLTVRLAGQLTPPPSLSLMLAHPTEAAEDIQLSLMLQPDGSYQGPLPVLAAGKRRLMLQPSGGEWRLSGLAEAPMAGELHLAANDSTTKP